MRTVHKLPRRSLIAAVLGSALALAAPTLAQPAPPLGGMPAPPPGGLPALPPGGFPAMPPVPPAPPVGAVPRADPAPGITSAKPLGSTWGDVARMPDFFSGNWMNMQSFLDKTNDTPLTPAAKAHAAKYKPIEDIPFAGPGCRTAGMPLVQRLGMPIKFFYEPGMIAIYIENSSMTRFIKLGGQHTPEPNPTYMGESIAHFEGDTLVIDSTGFRDDILLQYTNFPGKGTSPFILPPDTVFGPHGPNLRMVERMRLLDADTLEIKMTVYDDTVWTKPYVADDRIYRRQRGNDGWPNEWVCGVIDDPLEFDPALNASVMQDPEAVLKRIKEREGK